MNFTIADIDNVVKIIDAASQRGAFRGNELTVVGAVRDKFAAVILEAQKQNEKPFAVGPDGLAEKVQGELNFDTKSGKIDEVVSEDDNQLAE